MRFGIALAFQCDSLLTTGLANLNPQEGHITREGPGGRGGIELTITPLFPGGKLR
jgi:hypothetical protein